jgi:hypothetical protein
MIHRVNATVVGVRLRHSSSHWLIIESLRSRSVLARVVANYLTLIVDKIPFLLARGGLPYYPERVICRWIVGCP